MKSNDELTEGEANSDNAEYYVERREDAPDRYYRCFGNTAFVMEEGSTEKTTGAYELWMKDRNGPGVDRVAYEETPFEDWDDQFDNCADCGYSYLDSENFLSTDCPSCGNELDRETAPGGAA